MRRPWGPRQRHDTQTATPYGRRSTLTYRPISRGSSVPFIARAEAQVMRLACLYVALDRTAIVSTAHLEAGLAVWRYCEASVRCIFGDTLGDPLADEILRLLRSTPTGVTRTELSHYFGRHKPTEEITAALAKLPELRRVEKRDEPTEGRTAERWIAIV